jgi:hypothetical protein
VLFGVAPFAQAQDAKPSAAGTQNGEAAPNAVANNIAAAAVNSAQREAKAAQDEAEEAKDDLTVLKSGKLIASGLTGGLALTIQVPLGTINSTGQSASKATAMPYLLVLPGYFALPQATRVYCASNWGSGSETTAQRAAMAIAKERAEMLFDVIASAIRAGQQDDLAIATLLLKDKSIEITRKGQEKTVYSANEIIGFIRQWNSQKWENEEAKSQRRDAIVQWLATQDWNPGLRGSCGRTKLGLWVGKPLAYDVRSKVKDADEAERRFSSVVAFGLAYSPNAYFSVLGGVTLGNIEQVRDETSKVNVPSWAGTFAIGGNLDLLGSVFK